MLDWFSLFSVRLWNVPLPSLTQSDDSLDNEAKVIISCLSFYYLSLITHLIFYLSKQVHLGFVSLAATSSLCLEKCLLVNFDLFLHEIIFCLVLCMNS